MSQDQHSRRKNRRKRLVSALRASASAPQIPTPSKHLRKKYRTQLRQKPLRKALRWTVILLGAVGLGAGAWHALESTLPNTDNLAQATQLRPNTLTLKSADGQVIYQSGPSTRNPVSINEMPKQLKEAFLATEDRRFYNHDGLDLFGILRAMATNLISGQFAEGGSTLTQQLARISYLDQEQSLTRKFKEASVSFKIEQTLTKDEILERYLNQVYLGSGAYGVTDAAWVYFGKRLSDLTLPEMATLAGLPAAPSRYSPLVNPEVAQERRNLVLRRMEQAQYLTTAEMKAAQAQPLTVHEKPSPNLINRAPYFTDYLQAELERVLPETVLHSGGLTVETTLNQAWQDVATQTIQDTVAHEGWQQNFDQAALVSLDPATGAIKAMVGGADFETSQFNRATQAQRQPGSTFKAFVYTAAIAAGIPPSDGYLDAPIVVDGYRPKNYSGAYKGWVSMTEALIHSYNIPAVRVLIDVGFKPTLNLAKAMGIESKLDQNYSTALGANEVNLLELTNAYQTIAAQGTHIKPHSVVRVFNRQGKVIYEQPPKRTRALDKDSAAIMTWMLEQVVSSGTGVNAKLKRPVAGKTGTSEDYRDLWFVGFIPQLATGVWLGNDDNSPTRGTSATAAQTWQTFMGKVTANMPVEAFPNVPRLEGRKGSIKAEPIHPKQLLTEAIAQDPAKAEAEPESPEPEPSEPASSESESEAQGLGQ